MVTMIIDETRIEICGGIAAGKTSLSQLLNGVDVTIINENFEANPFIESFYEDHALYAFETEITFALQHYYDIKRIAPDSKFKVCDFSLFLDLAYADVTLSESERKAFISVHNEIVSKIGYPKALIYLRCDPVVLLNRIKNRQRVYEQGITVNYLSQVIKAIEKKIFDMENIKIIVIDTDRINFIEHDKQFISAKLKKHLNSLTSNVITDNITILSMDSK